MPTAFPSDLSKTNADDGGDFVGAFRSDAAGNVDKVNQLKTALGDVLGTDGTPATARTTMGVPSTAEIQGQAHTYAVTTGSATSFAATLSPAPAALASGLRCCLLTNDDFDAAAQLNVNSLGAKYIHRSGDGGRIQDGDIVADSIIELVYNALLESAAGAWQVTAPTAAQAGGGFQSRQIFTSSGTWNRPSGVTRILVRLVGGGGGGAAPGPDFGAGGAGGGYSEKLIDVSAISSVSVTVAAGVAQGVAGQTTSFGSHCSATGGAASGGAPGVGSGGDINLAGGRSPGAGATGNTAPIIWGGASAFSPATHYSEASGAGPGGGAAGGVVGVNGGVARTSGGGLVIVEEYA